MKVLIADAINEKGIENLKEHADVVVNTDITPEELLETIHEYEGIIVRSRTKVTREVIEKADNLKIIARAGVGVDNIDLDAATEKGIMVVNSPESTSITVAEHTMGLLLTLARNIKNGFNEYINNYYLKQNVENNFNQLKEELDKLGSSFRCIWRRTTSRRQQIIRIR